MKGLVQETQNQWGWGCKKDMVARPALRAIFLTVHALAFASWELPAVVGRHAQLCPFVFVLEQKKWVFHPLSFLPQCLDSLLCVCFDQTFYWTAL